MAELSYVTGIIIKSEPIGEYDRRIVMLTTTKGRLSAFVQGARRANSRMGAATGMFCFGDFGLLVRRNSYSIADINIKNYFSELHNDFEGAYYGMYFAEIAEYYSRENSDDKELMKLLYQSLRAIISDKIDNRLVRYIYEIKAVAVNGEFAMEDNEKYLSDTLYTVDYIVRNPVEKLFSFRVSDEVLEQLKEIASLTIKRAVDVRLNSLDILDTF